MKITIVGLGLIGGSLAMSLREARFGDEFIGVEINPHHAQRAIGLGLVSAMESIDAAARNSDLVILAQPVDAIASGLPNVLNALKVSGLVTDMGSAKELICKGVASHPRRSSFVASHPMAGTENSGPDAAIKGLFTGKTAVICDSEKSGTAELKVVVKMYETLKMRIVYMTSVEHDLHAAYVSHLSHISSFVLANTVLAKEQDVGTIFNLAGGGFESTVRLAKSSPAMWTPIFRQNRSHVIAALEAYMEHLKSFHSALLSEEWETASELMNKGNEIRRVLHEMGVNSRVAPPQKV